MQIKAILSTTKPITSLSHYVQQSVLSGVYLSNIRRYFFFFWQLVYVQPKRRFRTIMMNICSCRLAVALFRFRCSFVNRFCVIVVVGRFDCCYLRRVFFFVFILRFYYYFCLPGLNGFGCRPFITLTLRTFYQNQHLCGARRAYKIRGRYFEWLSCSWPNRRLESACLATNI